MNRQPVKTCSFDEKKYRYDDIIDIIAVLLFALKRDCEHVYMYTSRTRSFSRSEDCCQDRFQGRVLGVAVPCICYAHPGDGLEALRIAQDWLCTSANNNLVFRCFHE